VVVIEVVVFCFLEALEADDESADDAPHDTHASIMAAHINIFLVIIVVE
jgi:hypothetical protein